MQDFPPLVSGIPQLILWKDPLQSHLSVKPAAAASDGVDLRIGPLQNLCGNSGCEK